MKTIKRKLALLFIVFFSLKGICQSNYLNNILELEKSVSQQVFLDTILKIPYDKALSNVNQYIKLTKKAEKIALEIKDEKLLAKAYAKQSLSHHFTSDYDLAVEYTVKSALLYEKNNDINNFGKAYLDLGWRISKLNLEKGVNYMRKGLSILEKHNLNAIELIGGYNNFGVLKFRNSELDSALYFHNKSLSLCYKLNDKIGIPYAQIHIAEIYLKKEKTKEAKELLDKAMLFRKEINDTYGITDTYLYYGDYYLITKEYNKAIEVLKEAYRLADKYSYFPSKQYATKTLVKVYEAKNDYKNAIKYLKFNQQLKDSVINTKTNNKIAQLEIEFKTSEKEKEIALQKEEILENELKIKNRNLYTVLLGSALLVVGILSIGYYHRSNFKRKQLEKEIKLKDALSKIKTQNRLQEQRLRISRDLHDNIGSQLTFIISSIDNLKYISKDLNNVLKNKLTNISEFTSNTIHQLRDTIWAMNKNEISVDDFSTRLLSFIEKAKEAVPSITFKYKNDIPSNYKLTSIEGMNLFRVTQEAINNAVKYSEGDLIELNATQKNNKLQLTIQDNGKGFDINNVTLGSGLSNMEKRISSINGSIFITSENEKGTTITLQIDNTTNDV